MAITMKKNKHLHIVLSQGKDDDLIARFEAMQAQFGHGVCAAIVRAALRLYFGQNQGLSQSLHPLNGMEPNTPDSGPTPPPESSVPNKSDQGEKFTLLFDEELPPVRAAPKHDDDDDNVLGFEDDRV